MFDANARHLKKGTMFFARKDVDLLYCKMLESDHKNPRIKILTSYENDKGYKGHIYRDDWHNPTWGFAVFSGYVEDGELRSFINEEEKAKAKSILDRLAT